MLPSMSGTAVKLGISDSITYTFVFSGKALDRVMLNYIIIKDIEKRTTELIEDYEKINDLYNCYINQIFNVVSQSVANEYKPIEWRNQQ